MKAQDIIAAVITKVKEELQKHNDPLNQPLSSDHAETVVNAILNAVLVAGAEGFKTYLAQNEIHENTIVHEGEKYQFNCTSKKEFQTPLGKTVVQRRLYQNKNGDSFIPLDHAWNMEHQFATPEVREAVLYAVSLMPAKEAHQLFGQCSSFNLAEGVEAGGYFFP